MTTPEYQLPDAQIPIRSSNLPVVSEADASPEVQGLYAKFRDDFGRPQVPGILQCFATHPPLLESMMGLAKTMLFADGALDRKHKEMIATFVSAKNHCAYCTDSHGSFLRSHGATEEVVAATISCDLHSAVLSRAQRALLHFAQKVSEDSANITTNDVEELRALHWSDLQIAETVHLTALFACFNRVVNAFGLPSQGLTPVYSAKRTESGGPDLD